MALGRSVVGAVVAGAIVVAGPAGATVRAAPASEPARAQAPPPAAPSPETVELRDRQRKAEQLAIGGYVVTGVGGLVALLSLPPLISARIEKDKEANFFQEAGDPEAVRTKRRLGIGMLGAGLGVAALGRVLVGIGLTRRKRHTRELDELSRPRASATLTPVAGPEGAGIAWVGRF